VPEGNVIHRIVRDQSPLLVGGPVEVSSPQGRFAVGAALVDGSELKRIEAYGKHLFHHWDNGFIGHIHLGLFGKYRVHLGVEPPDPIGLVRMRMSTERATIDLAGPTACEVGTAEERAGIIARLGPDPLRRDAKPEVAVARIARSRQPIGAILLDQKIISGVGNIYRAESLFVLGIHPLRPGAACTTDELRELWVTLRTMLRRGVREGRIVTIDRSELGLSRAAFRHGRVRRGEANYVYHRDICLRCGTPIETVELAGRPCYFCPTCQPR
jgi:endonuclease-8